jgi:hypothetical protein
MIVNLNAMPSITEPHNERKSRMTNQVVRLMEVGVNKWSVRTGTGQSNHAIRQVALPK